MSRVTLLACGEPLRGDDGVARAIVRRLPAATRPLAEVREVGGLMPDDILDAGAPLIVIDAVHGPPPGTLIDLPLAQLAGVADAGPTPSSSHVLPIGTVLGIVERLGGDLSESRFIGVAAADFAMGASLSRPVRRAVEVAAVRCAYWIEILAGRPEVPACA